MTNQLFLALDFGGTKLSAAIAARGECAWRALERSVSPRDKDARYEYDTMLARARRLLGDQTPAAIGVSFGGPVDAARGRVVLSHHVRGWEDTPLRDQLHAAFGAPVSIDNDANVAALGEFKSGAGQGCASLLYITVSTGVGGGWVIDGKIFSGADGLAGEIGHTIVDPHGPLCICGRRGCVEITACGPAIAREARARLSAAPSEGTRLRALIGNDLRTLTAEHVSSAANAGDELARAVIDAAAHALGFGIGTAITLMNPERIVLGGGVTKSGERWWNEVRAAARANTLPQMRVDIVSAALGDDAPLWGAIALAEDLTSNAN
jgi:glucokinase